MAINIVDRIIEDYQAMSMPEEDLGFDPVKYRMENGKIVPKGVGALLIDEEKYRKDIDGYSAIVPPSGTKKQTRESYIKAWNEMPAHYPRDWTSLQKWAYGNKSKSELKAKAEELGRMSPEERQSFWESGKTLSGDSNLRYAPYGAIVGVPENTQSVLKQTADYMELGYSKEGAQAQIERDFIGHQVVKRHNQKAEDWSFQKVMFAVGALATGAVFGGAIAGGGLTSAGATPATLGTVAAEASTGYAGTLGAVGLPEFAGYTTAAGSAFGAAPVVGTMGSGLGGITGVGIGATSGTLAASGLALGAGGVAPTAPVATGAGGTLASTVAPEVAATTGAGGTVAGSVAPEVAAGYTGSLGAVGAEPFAGYSLMTAPSGLAAAAPLGPAAWASGAGVTGAAGGLGGITTLGGYAPAVPGVGAFETLGGQALAEGAKGLAEVGGNMGWLDTIWNGVKSVGADIAKEAIYDTVVPSLTRWGQESLFGDGSTPMPPGNIVQTQQKVFPDEGQPTFEAPEWNQREIDAGAQRKAGAPTRRLQDAVNRALAFSTENPNVDSMKARDTLAGYGMGLGNVMAGAEGAALGEYATKYGREYDTAKTNFDTDLTKWTDSAQIVQTQNRYDRPQPAPVGTNFGLPDWLRNQERNP